MIDITCQGDQELVNQVTEDQYLSELTSDVDLLIENINHVYVYADEQMEELMEYLEDLE